MLHVGATPIPVCPRFKYYILDRNPYTKIRLVHGKVRDAVIGITPPDGIWYIELYFEKVLTDTGT